MPTSSFIRLPLKGIGIKLTATCDELIASFNTFAATRIIVDKIPGLETEKKKNPMKKRIQRESFSLFVETEEKEKKNKNRMEFYRN